MSKIKWVLIEVREDQNEESARIASQNKTKADKTPKPKAATALPANQESPSNESKGLPVPKVKPKAKPNPKPKAKGDKGNGDDNPKSSGTGKDSAEGNPKGAKDKTKSKAEENPKSNVACLFWAKGTCNLGDACPLHHDPKARPAAKPKAAAPANVKATAALLVASRGLAHTSACSQQEVEAVFDEARRLSWSVLKSSNFAFVKPLIAMMSYCNGVLSSTSEYAATASLVSTNVSLKDSYISCPAVIADEHAMIAQADNLDTYRLEWVADSGAGKDLASLEALVEQSVPSSIVHACVQSDDPIKFECGNGVTVSDTRSECSGNKFGK